MTEITALLTGSEIAMLQDFIAEDKPLDFHEYWGDEIRTLLLTLAHIVTAPGFEINALKEQYEEQTEKTPPSTNND